MQDVDGRRRIDPLDAKSHRVIVEFADCDALFPCRRQMCGNLVSRIHDADVEVTRPVAVRRAWHDVPVVVWLVVNEYRRFARRVDQVGMRQGGQWRPAHKVRVCLERVEIVVEESALGTARVNNRVAGPGLLERTIMAIPEDIEVLAVQGGQRGIGVGIVRVHDGIIPCCPSFQRVPLWAPKQGQRSPGCNDSDV